RTHLASLVSSSSAAPTSSRSSGGSPSSPVRPSSRFATFPSSLLGAEMDSTTERGAAPSWTSSSRSTSAFHNPPAPKRRLCHERSLQPVRFDRRHPRERGHRGRHRGG